MQVGGLSSRLLVAADVYQISALLCALPFPRTMGLSDVSRVKSQVRDGEL